MPCQQDNLYRAEQRVPNKGRTITPGELQAYVDNLRESEWWQRNFPTVMGIDTHYKKNGGASSVGGMVSPEWGQIEMLPCHMCELYILHEVCHALAEARFNSCSHDPWFARLYLEAVYTFLGPDIYRELWQAFSTESIDCDTPNPNPSAIAL